MGGWQPPLTCHPTRDAGQKEIEWAICCGHQQSYPGLDNKAEVPTIQLVGFKSTRDKIRELYNDVY